MIVANPPRETARPAEEDAAAATVAGETTEPAPAPVVTRIRPPQGWQGINVRELWQFRELIYFLAWRDVKVRYKQTVLGAAWAILQPLMMMVVFTIFFGRVAGVAHGELPYPLFAYAGLLPWTFFATAIAAAGNSVVGSERLITKIYFPRLAVPLAAVGAAVVDFLIAFGLLAVMMAYYRVAPGPGLLLMPAVFLAILLAALGVGTLLAALNVAYRDFRYVIPFLVQLWMFATPSVYMQVADAPARSAVGPASSQVAPAGASPDAGEVGRRSLSPVVRVALTLNPMTGLIDAFRASVLGGAIPWGKLVVSSVCAATVCMIGCFYFRRVEDGFADII
jgi:lipopolysaccharide transport system permease protein